MRRLCDVWNELNSSKDLNSSKTLYPSWSDHGYNVWNACWFHTTIKFIWIKCDVWNRPDSRMLLCALLKSETHIIKLTRKLRRQASTLCWIYFNRLQNTGAKLFRIWKTCHRAHKRHQYQLVCDMWSPLVLGGVSWFPYQEGWISLRLSHAG